jgi:5-methylcytosine-specific restriction endonuclease McrA
LNAHVSQGGWPVLVLNADFRPLSYYPLSLWSWQDAIKAVFLDRVNIVEHYDRAVRSPSFEIQLPSVVSLKSFVKPTTHTAFTRFNVFLRDRFVCQYCSADDDLTFDHIVPRSKGGQTTWENVVAACSPCNLRKGKRRSHRRCISCTATAGCSRRTICTIVGSTISIGTPNSIREDFDRLVPHQEDTGLDIYCTLLERSVRRAGPRAYYSAQAKKHRGAVDFCGAEIGSPDD